MEVPFLISFFKEPVDIRDQHSFYKQQINPYCLLGGDLDKIQFKSVSDHQWEFKIQHQIIQDDYLLLSYNLQNQKILETNRTWLTNVFAMETANAIHYTSDLRIFYFIKSQKSDFRLDLPTVQFFLEKHYVPIGKTLFEGIRQISCFYNSAECPSEYNENQTMDLLWQEFVNTIDLFTSGSRSFVFNLSGGIDTRLVSFALAELGRHPDSVKIVKSPLLDEDQDADVYLAKLVTQKMAWNSQIIHPEKMTAYNYFTHESYYNRALGGLYGGEFLGGQVSTFSHLDGLGYLDKVQVFMKTFRSTIYDSVAYSWSEPYKLHDFAFSAFSTRNFIQKLMAVPEEKLHNYGLYTKLYEKLKSKYFDFPLNTGLASYNHQYQLKNYKLTDPKSICSLIRAQPQQQPVPEMHLFNTMSSKNLFRFLNLLDNQYQTDLVQQLVKIKQPP